MKHLYQAFGRPQCPSERPVAETTRRCDLPEGHGFDDEQAPTVVHVSDDAQGRPEYYWLDAQ